MSDFEMTWAEAREFAAILLRSCRINNEAICDVENTPTGVVARLRDTQNPVFGIVTLTMTEGRARLSTDIPENIIHFLEVSRLRYVAGQIQAVLRHTAIVGPRRTAQ